jgi:hypothetical protein
LALGSYNLASFFSLYSVKTNSNEIIEKNFPVGRRVAGYRHRKPHAGAIHQKY